MSFNLNASTLSKLINKPIIFFLFFCETSREDKGKCCFYWKSFSETSGEKTPGFTVFVGAILHPDFVLNCWGYTFGCLFNYSPKELETAVLFLQFFSSFFLGEISQHKK
jgi:hypothetical protein